MPKLSIYEEMVLALAKPGTAIVNDLTAEEAHLWHMATGIAGEAGEIMLVFTDVLQGKPLDIENLAEEIGDCLFYMTGLQLATNLPTIPLLPSREFGWCETFAYTTAISATILDLVKKHVIYKKGLNIEDIHEQLLMLRDYLSNLARLAKTDLSTCRDKNIEKLYTGPMARYRSLGYSDEAAQERRDKSDS